MIFHNQICDLEISRLIRAGKIAFGGNVSLKIYGTLRCGSGKKMLKKNRVFFKREQDALAAGFRPCGHCMRDAYRKWKPDSDARQRLSEQEAG